MNKSKRICDERDARERHSEANRKYRLAHPDRVRLAKKKWIMANPEKIRQHQATYRGNHPETKTLWAENNRTRALEISKNWINNNVEKHTAHKKLNAAVRHGKITQLPCEKCGDLRTHGHHDDYSKPLSVRWICAKHHKELHFDR